MYIYVCGNIFIKKKWREWAFLNGRPLGGQSSIYGMSVVIEMTDT